MPNLRLILIAVVAFVVFFLAETPAQAATGDTYIVYWMASTRGYDHDGDGQLEWCAGSLGWHGSGDAMDELNDRAGAACRSYSGEKVDVAAQGYTYCQSGSSSCVIALKGYGSDGVYADGCDYIRVYYYSWWTGEYRGQRRHIHARDSISGTWYIEIKAGKSSWTNTWYEIGHLVNDSNCQGGSGWTDYHVHHDNFPYCIPTYRRNPNLSAGGQNYEKWDWYDYIHRWAWTEGSC